MHNKFLSSLHNKSPLSGNLKIRLLLLLLAIGFACTAITINYTIQDEEVLSLEAGKIEQAFTERSN